ncbi:transcriptional regulator GcvA [Rhodobacteraceae bacterium B1Z28]|uniref:Transcriptional regulator GcvA n=1 Tax=Ruegeria haliotis TaxID=2747601 RepID=A0ABX2PS58_9RHOB|nr:transcriptional regulator GcvA [Ruegeria haliotis]NVO56980.1 transcriptional regulator GcvA [Ruegeria haliotis]
MQLPPLNSLRAFESAARLLSFSNAGEELSVTQTAISHQIKQLEQWFDVKLFTREGRGIALTKEGYELLADIRPAFDRIRNAAEKFSARASRRSVSVSVTPTFGARWLSSRLGNFMLQHPEVDLNIQHTVRPANLDTLNVDISVRRGLGDWPDVECKRLMSADLIPFFSPVLPIQSIKDLEHATLLHYLDYQEWTDWFSCQGIQLNAEQEHGPCLDSEHALVEAAISGAGVIMGHRSLLLSELEKGQLVAPFEGSLDPRLGFYVVCLKSSLKKKDVRAFRDFLFEERSKQKRIEPHGKSGPTRT